MFTQLKDLLDRSINKNGLRSNVDALNVVNEYKKIVEESFGKDAPENLIPRYYKNYNLHIDASSASWAQHFVLNQSTILEKLNDKIGKKEVKKFVIRITNKSLTTINGEIN